MCFRLVAHNQYKLTTVFLPTLCKEDFGNYIKNINLELLS